MKNPPSGEEGSTHLIGFPRRRTVRAKDLNLIRHGVSSYILRRCGVLCAREEYQKEEYVWLMYPPRSTFTRGTSRQAVATMLSFHRPIKAARISTET